MSEVIPPPAQAAPAITQAPAAAPPTDKPAAPAEVHLTSDALAKRLEEERASARTRLLKELGYEKAEDLKGALAKAKSIEDASLTEQQRTAKLLEELTPKAKRADTLSATLTKFLAAEEAAIPEAKRGLLDLAPLSDNPEARLEWIATAKARGLFTDAAPQPPALPPPAKPATTLAPSGPATPKAPGTLTAYEQHQALVKSGQTLRAAAYAQLHAREIAASKPQQ